MQCLHIQFSCMRTTIVALKIKASIENKISRSKSASFVSITLFIDKRRRYDELTQCFSRTLVAFLTENETFHENNFEFILNLIKTLQKKNVFAQTCLKNINTFEKIQNEDDFISDYTWENEFLKYHDRYYILKEKFLRSKLFKRHHDDSFANHFDVEKIKKLLSRKYYWKKMIKNIKSYVDTCDICQRTKTLKHRSYDELQSFSLSQESWQKLTMNFITDFSFNKHFDSVYDVIFVIVDRYTKMIQYISITKKLIATNLIEIIFEKIVLKFDASKNIVFDKESIFINAYWFDICYHLKIKRRLNIVFHSQTDEQTKRQNQILKHYLRMFCFEKQINWVIFLSLIEYVYQNNVQSTIDCSSFYCMYDYNFEIRYEVENDYEKKKCSLLLNVLKNYTISKTIWLNVDEKSSRRRSNITTINILSKISAQRIW